MENRLEMARASAPPWSVITAETVRARFRTLPQLAVATLALSAASAATVTVGPDDGTCPAAIFRRIQSAVDAAVPGSTIVVCAGTYPEQVVLTKRVRLLAFAGARLAPAGMQVTATSPSSGRPVAAAVTLSAPATVDGLAIDAAAHGVTACDGSEPLLAGIYVGGVAATVTGNDVAGLRIPGAPAGCENGVGILVQGARKVARVRVEGNTVAGYERAGIVVEGPELRAIVRENLVVGGGDAAPATHVRHGIEVDNGTAARVEDNVVRDHRGITGTACEPDAGIVVSAPRIRLVGNQLEGNVVGLVATSRGHTIRENAVDGGDVGLVGLDLDGDEMRVVGNDVGSAAAAGIRVGGNRNRLRDNLVAGVHAVPACDAARALPGCDAALARCGAALWFLGRANLAVRSVLTDADQLVADDGRANVVR